MDVTAERYCRDLEAYLCRKNDGHLVRIVGPAFEQVCRWAARGVPLKIAQRGIDRYFDRYYAKGARRRPVRIEFCEADVLDVFDEWRRAVGVTFDTPDDESSEPSDRSEESPGPADEPQRRSGSLPAHVDRLIARLTTLRAGADRSLDSILGTIVAELDAARATVKGLRGSGREAFIDRLGALDRMLMDAARAHGDVPTVEQLIAEAEEELSHFRGRMPPDAYQRAQAACVDRGIRERLGLPVISFD